MRSQTRTPFSLMAKPTGAACNLDCEYCFFLSKEALWEGQGQRMSSQHCEIFRRNTAIASRRMPGGTIFARRNC